MERFIASHGAPGAARLERNQHLVVRIYALREAFESIARGVTADPNVMDVRWKERVEHGNERK